MSCIARFASISIVSQYQIFRWMHCLSLPFWVLMIFHEKNFWLWLLVPGSIYLLEVLWRVMQIMSGKGKTFVSTAVLLPSRVTHLVIKRPKNFDYHPGDYVFINVPTIASSEWHPFTISSAPEQQGGPAISISFRAHYQSAIRSRPFLLFGGRFHLSAHSRRRWLDESAVPVLWESAAASEPRCLRLQRQVNGRFYSLTCQSDQQQKGCHVLDVGQFWAAQNSFEVGWLGLVVWWSRPKFSRLSDRFSNVASHGFALRETNKSKVRRLPTSSTPNQQPIGSYRYSRRQPVIINVGVPEESQDTRCEPKALGPRASYAPETAPNRSSDVFLPMVTFLAMTPFWPNLFTEIFSGFPKIRILKLSTILIRFFFFNEWHRIRYWLISPFFIQWSGARRRRRRSRWPREQKTRNRGHSHNFSSRGNSCLLIGQCCHVSWYFFLIGRSLIHPRRNRPLFSETAPTQSTQSAGHWRFSLMIKRIVEWTTCMMLVATTVQVIIDGPYGAPSSHIFHAEHAVLIAAGIGVTPFASILQSIMHRYWNSKQHCPNCKYSWNNQMPESIRNLKKVSARFDRLSTVEGHADELVALSNRWIFFGSTVSSGVSSGSSTCWLNWRSSRPKKAVFWTASWTCTCTSPADCNEPTWRRLVCNWRSICSTTRYWILRPRISGDVLFECSWRFRTNATWSPA